MTGAVMIIIVVGGSSIPAITAVPFRNIRACEEVAAVLRQQENFNWLLKNAVIVCARDN